MHNKILSPKEWELILKEHFIYHESDKEFLLNNNYFKIDKYFIPPDYIKT